MSRTYKTAPTAVRSRRAANREENHIWCENETVDTASPWKYGRFARRAEYETYVTGYTTEQCFYVLMRDSKGGSFRARMVKGTRRNPEGLEYDREAHPDAKFVYDRTWYGGEWMNTRRITHGTYDRPHYRHRLIGWIEEPIRECDIDDPNGVCYYRCWDLKWPSPHNRVNRRIYSEKPKRQYERETLNDAKAEYNAFGKTEIVVDPNVRGGHWWW